MKLAAAIFRNQGAIAGTAGVRARAVRRSRRFIGLLPIASIAFGGAVEAQEIGSRIKRYQPAEIQTGASLTPVEKAQATMNAYGECLVDMNAKRVAAFLALPLGEKAKAAGAALSVVECLSEGSLSFPQELLRGSLYRALYRRSFARVQPPLAEKPIDYVVDVGGTIADPEANQYVALRQFSECVVRADVVHSRDFVLGQPGSANAKAGFSALGPLFGPCMQQGVNVRFSRPMISALIAESLYRLSMPSASSAGSH